MGASVALAQNRIAGRFGEAVVGNERVIVHVTVAVPPGLDGNAVAENALRGLGARPFADAEFQTSGLVWNQFFNSMPDEVVQNYNPTGDPVGALVSLENSQRSWSAAGTQFNSSSTITTSFRFKLGETNITRCPSLVQECPGTQVFDGFNDVGWLAIGGCCTLGVTWYSTSTDEADMALNTQFQWTTHGGDGFDVETVFLHENGHVLGLGHSPVVGAVMEATYATVRRGLHLDDARGVTYLYPALGWTGSISGVVSSPSGGIRNAKVSIPNFPLAATTNSSGQYSLNGLPKLGLYSVTASAKGYSAQTQNDVAVPATVNFTLQSSGGGGGGCVPKGNGNNCR
jgi:hypothetical protein